MKRGFIDPSLYPELKDLTINIESIREELRQVDRWFKWTSDAITAEGMCSFLKGNWTIFPLYFPKMNLMQVKIPGLYQLELEQHLEAVQNNMPKTAALLRSIPQLKFSSLSRLSAHSVLEPHRHVNPGSFIAHAGLEIPPGNSCGLKVASSIHHWKKPGDLVVFNDNYLHSAWNHSDQERVVLYMDLLRPYPLAPS